MSDGVTRDVVRIERLDKLVCSDCGKKVKRYESRYSQSVDKESDSIKCFCKKISVNEERFLANDPIDW